MIGPMIVAAIAFGVFLSVNTNPLGKLVEVPTPIGEKLQATEWQARFLWESTVVLLVVGSIAAIVFSLFIIHHFLETPTRRRVYGFMAGLSALAIFISLTRPDVSLDYTRVAILEPTIGILANSKGTIFSLQMFEISRMITNSLVSVATLIFSFAMMACTTISSIPPSSTQTDDRKIDRHVDQLKAMSDLLYVGTFVLISLVLSMVAWLQWPAALLDSPDEQARVTKIAVGLGVFWGMTFTLMLAAAYLPAALFMRVQAFSLAEQFSGGGTPAKKDEWIEDHGLKLSLTAQVSRVVAIAGPLIAGVFPWIQSLGI